VNNGKLLNEIIFYKIFMLWQLPHRNFEVSFRHKDMDVIYSITVMLSQWWHFSQLFWFLFLSTSCLEFPDNTTCDWNLFGIQKGIL